VIEPAEKDGKRIYLRREGKNWRQRTWSPVFVGWADQGKIDTRVSELNNSYLYTLNNNVLYFEMTFQTSSDLMLFEFISLNLHTCHQYHLQCIPSNFHL